MRRASAGLAALALAACAPSTPARRGGPTAAPAPIDVTLGPTDVFEVRIYGEADLSGTYRVDADGTIDFPLVGRLRVAGQVPSEVATMISERLAQGYLKSPQVSILVKEYNSKKVTVIGQVQKPGTFPYLVRMSVVEVVSLAGGFTSLAAANDVVVRRAGKTFKVRVADIAEGKAPTFYLEPGDTLLVPERIF